MLQFQTAGISLILIRILRYFTHTQTDIQTATTDSVRHIYPIFLFLRGSKVGPTWCFEDLTEVVVVPSPNSNEAKAVRACVTTWLLFYCCMSRFQTAGISLILIRMLRYFTDRQTAIQTATTHNFRQINPIFLFFKTVQSWPHVVFWRFNRSCSCLSGSPNSNETKPVHAPLE